MLENTDQKNSECGHFSRSVGLWFSQKPKQERRYFHEKEVTSKVKKSANVEKIGICGDLII